MAFITRVFFWGYALMLVGIGVSGTLIAPWELRTVFDLPIDTLAAPAAATLLNQCRFLKAIELSFGLFCVTYRGDIFHIGVAHRLFLIGVFSGVAARFTSWIVDGRPHTAFVAFTVLEATTGLLVWFSVASVSKADI
ncbi:DUF4345 family protein [Paraburkholderia elongata]|nr:DUF4345 family protein [Paraburkholderia elongata]